MHPITRNIRDFRIDRFTLFIAALSILAICLVIARQITYGVGLGVDSSTYISVARNLLDGDGFVRWMNNEPYMRWPPIYPLLLVVSSLFIFDPIDIAGLVNAIIFGATVFVAGTWLRERIASNFLAVWGCIAVAIAIPLLQVAYTAMAEAPFILFTTLSLIWTDKFLRYRKLSFLIWAAVFTALACLTRYIGVSLIIAVLPFLALQHHAKASEKMRLIGAYLLIALIPLCVWTLRNLLISQSFTGYNPASNSYLINDVNDIFTGIATWALVGVPAEEVSFIAVISAGVFLISLTVVVAGTALQARSDQQDEWNATTLFVAFVLIYLVMLILSARATPVYPLSGRHITPIYIPLLLTSTFILDRFWSYDPVHKMLGTVADIPILSSIAPKKFIQITLSKIVLVVILVQWLMISVPANAVAISSANETLGPSKGVTRHFNSETLRYARENLIEGAILTNLWIGHAYLFTDASAYHPLPADTDELSVSQTHKLRRFIETTDDEVHIVWTYDSDNPHIRPNIDVLPEVKLVKEFADGIIYQVGKARWNVGMYETALSSEPVINSVFNVYLSDRNLIYIKEQCSYDDLDASFFLHIFPASNDDLPESRAQSKSKFENLDFGFYAYGVKFEDRCMATVPFPEYQIMRIATGQFTSDARMWEGEIALDE